jgi:L-rhamnose mutarotase
MSYIQFVNALQSKKTKEKYTKFLNAFLIHANIGWDEVLQIAKTSTITTYSIYYRYEG